MDIIVNGSNGNGHGTFKFQYSRRIPVKEDPRFVPHNDKKLAENILGTFFCEFLRREYHSVITEYKHNSDDSYKKPDVIFVECGIAKGIQITELQFTRHEERKALSKRVNEQMVREISKLVVPKYPIIVNIFPVGDKASIPLSEVKKGKSNIMNELAVYIATLIKDNQGKFDSDASPIWHTISHTKLSVYYQQVVLNRIPINCYSRFYGHNNVYVNYDIDDVSFSDNDVDDAIQNVYRRKNSGYSDILLIWSDEFELATLSKRTIAEKISHQFRSSTFAEVFFMTFVNNPPMFQASLELWALKGPRVPMKPLE